MVSYVLAESRVNSVTKEEKELREILELARDGEGRKNYSVKAGAGGGKTTLLSKRICAQIMEGTPIEEFLVITYTNAAAAELREKITGQLKKLRQGGALTQTQKDKVSEALNTIELMQISTIHAFLLKILREYAFEAGIVLDAELLQDDADKERKKKFFDEWYYRHFDEMTTFTQDWTITQKSSGKPVDYSRSVLENTFYNLANVRETVIYDTSDRSAANQKAAEDYINFWLPKAVLFKNQLLASNPFKADKKTPQQLLTDAKNVVNLISSVEGKSVYEIADACNLSEAMGIIKDKMEKENSFYRKPATNFPLLSVMPDYPAFEPEWNFKKRYEEYMLYAEKAAKVVEYICGMQKEYQKQTDRETKVLSNEEILFRAEKLLRENSEILEKLRAGYSKIYIDEFQDTTGIQTRIMNLLAGKKGSTAGIVEYTEDKLLVVGDPKQSIYRFTGAEKAVYDMADAFIGNTPEAHGEAVSLNTNFRSNSDIVDWVNRSYTALLKTDYTPMDTDWNVQEKNSLHGVYKYATSADSYSKEDDVKAVVELVEELVDNEKFFLEEYNRNENSREARYKLRKIRYSDIMIICRNTMDMSDYVEKFAERAIPVNVQGKFDINKDQVLNNFVSLVEYFARPKNKKVRMIAAQNRGRFDVTNRGKQELLKATEEELNKLRKFFQEKNMDEAAIVQHLMSHVELYLPGQERYKPEQIRAYRIRLHQMVESCLMNNQGDLLELVTLMKKYLDTKVKREIPLESNERAVSLMNVHQSKGLTGKIVIIAKRNSSENCKFDGFKHGGKYYPSVSYTANYHKTVVKPSYGNDLDILKLAYVEEQDENIRLQYVAATRAAHALIIMPVISGRNSSPWFTEQAYQYDSLRNIRQWMEERKEDSTEYLLQEDAEKERPIMKQAQLQENLLSTEVEGLTEEISISIMPSGLEPKGVTGYVGGESGYVKEERPSANVFGTVMHRAFELLITRYEYLMSLELPEREKEVQGSIYQAILEQEEELRASDSPEDFATYLKKILGTYLETVIKPIMDSAEEVYPEYSFSFYVSKEEREGFLDTFATYFKEAKEPIEIGGQEILVNGQADLVVKHKDGTIKVYDYKSDSRNGKALKEFEESLEKKYAGQLALYQYAIGKAFGVEKVDTELIHLYR